MFNLSSKASNTKLAKINPVGAGEDLRSFLSLLSIKNRTVDSLYSLILDTLLAVVLLESDLEPFPNDKC